MFCSLLHGGHSHKAAALPAARPPRAAGETGPRSEAANRAFSPDPAAIEDARGLIAAHDAAKAEGRGVTTFNGRMVEVLHVAAARRLLAFADAIAAR